MKSYKIITSFVSPEGLQALANKIGIDFMIFILICLKMLYIVFQYGCKLILIQRILIGLKAILKKTLNREPWGQKKIREMFYWIMGGIQSYGFLCIFIVAFLQFLALVRGCNPSEPIL